MLCVLILAAVALAPDDPPKPKPRPSAMILDLSGRVEIRPVEGPPRAAELEDLIYPGERLWVPPGGSATVSILGAGARETIKPGSEATFGPKGGSPSEAIAARKEQPRAVSSTMKGLKPATGDGRKAGVVSRDAPERPRAITPIFGTTVESDRPALAWPPAEKAATYRVKLLSGAGRELWKAEVKEAALPFPEGKEALTPGYCYRWEVTDQDYQKLASGEFTVASTSERQQLEELRELVRSGDRADRLAAAMSYRRIGAYADAIATFERLARESPDEPGFRKALDELERRAGRRGGVEAAESAK